LILLLWSRTTITVFHFKTLADAEAFPEDQIEESPSVPGTKDMVACSAGTSLTFP
jgi:hypothetical protein